jgi:hypothetical protein
MSSFIYNGQEFKEGDKVVCEIRSQMEWHRIDDARISIEKTLTGLFVYIHQNFRSGNGCSKYGYKYGWSVEFNELAYDLVIISNDTKDLRLAEVFPK